MGQDTSVFLEEEADSYLLTSSPFANPGLSVTPKPIKSEAVPYNILKRKREQHGSTADSRCKTATGNIAAVRRFIPAINLLSEDEDEADIIVKHEILEITEPEISSKSFTPNRLHLKSQPSPEIIPFSQILPKIETEEIIPLESSSLSSVKLEADIPDFSSEVSQFLESPGLYSITLQSQNSQSAYQGKLKGISSEWRQKFIETQRSPPRRTARRKRLRAKKPLTVPQLSAWRKFKARDVHQEVGSKFISDGVQGDSRSELLGRQSPHARESVSGKIETLLGEFPNTSKQETSQTPLPYTCVEAKCEGIKNPIGRSWLGKTQKPSFLKPHSDVWSFKLGGGTFLVYADFVRWHCLLLAKEYLHNCGHSISMLRDIEAEVFGLFINWLYLERVVNKRDEPPFQQRTMGLWILATRLQMPRLANDAIDGLEARRRKEGEIQTKAFHFVYGNTKARDTLRRYIIEVCLHFSPQISEQGKKERLPDELVEDIFMASLNDQIKPEGGEIDTTKYHIISES